MHDIDALKAEFLNHEFEARTFEIDAAKSAAYALAVGETDPRFTDPAHDNFQAPPTIASSLARRTTPDNFPRLGGMGMDAGKGVDAMAPLRCGITLTGKSHLHDIYTKTGRSGRMIFLVTRMEIFDPDGVHVANADTRTVIREKPE